MIYRKRHWFYCCDCGLVFNEDEAGLYAERESGIRLIACPECGSTVIDDCVPCPLCGQPMARDEDMCEECKLFALMEGANA